MTTLLKRIFLLAVFCGAVSLSYGESLPKPEGLVSDFAGVLSEQKKAELNAELEELENKTTVEAALVTVKNTGGLSIEEYSFQLAQGWGIGKKGKDNGVLFLITTDDRHTRIEVGYGLEGVLTDGTCGKILDDYVVTPLGKGDYESAAVSGTSAILGVIYKAYNENPENVSGKNAVSKRVAENRKALASVIFLFLIIAFYFLRIFIPLNRYGRYGGRGGYWGGGFGGGGFGGGGFGGFGGGGFGGGGASR